MDTRINLNTVHKLTEDRKFGVGSVLLEEFHKENRVFVGDMCYSACVVAVM
jgi:hypothetical protein